jgi:glycerophosphoryl diester phosphodiesterase
MPRKFRHQQPDDQFTLIAHRGFSSDAPENTYDAFDLAIAHGFNNIETDVQLTADGVAVLIHDTALDRTTNGNGAVAQANIGYVKSLDAGVWFEAPVDGVGRHGPASYGDTFVPTLEEFLERYKGKVNLHLELKSFEQGLSAKVATLLDEYGWVRPESPDDPGVSISSFDASQIWRSKNTMPRLDHGFLLRHITALDSELAISIGCSGIYPLASDVTPEDVKVAEMEGLTVRTWGVRTEDDLLRTKASGAIATTADWPLRAQRILAG